MATFRQKLVVDEGGQFVAGVSGRIYDIEDVAGATPLDVLDAAGVPIVLLQIPDSGINPSFEVEDRTQVRWISEDGNTQVIFESLEGMEERAAQAEATAATAVQQVGQFVNLLGVPGGVAALNSEGNVVDANDDVVGNDTRRAGAVIAAYGSQTTRPTQSRDVCVLWFTEGPAPVGAVPGVDYWMNGSVDL